MELHITTRNNIIYSISIFLVKSNPDNCFVCLIVELKIERHYYYTLNMHLRTTLMKICTVVHSFHANWLAC